VSTNNESETFKKSTAREYFESLAITVILALFGTTFIVQAFKIPTPSMESNLLVGDHLLVNKFAFGLKGSALDGVLPFRDIERGNIIVFKFPRDLGKHFVKRVIGLPGDRIKIFEKKVYVNGSLLDESAFHTQYTGDPHLFFDGCRDYLPPRTPFDVCSSEGDPEWFKKFKDGDSVLVPPDRFFAMGDNRDNSLDSRYWGFVPRAYIIGKPLIVYWSYGGPEPLGAPTNWNERMGQIKELVMNFIPETRWSRTFKVIR
jgi:signal peptidase I